jgi:selenide,water dikinase
VGPETSDDAAVYRLTPELAIVQTVDYITPVVDDPYACGAVAAANSLSDIYAMGARPLFALNVVGFPTGTLPLSVLEAILKGGADKAAEAGVAIVGGHSIDDPEPKYGLVVTGIVHPEKVLTNAGARVGDDLILTKPLGMGIITTGIKRQKVAAETVDQAVATMSTLNRYAAEVMEAVGGVHACTDVTGFGLLGHLRIMLASSGCAARVDAAAVPLLPGVLGLAQRDFVAAGTKRNHAWLQETTDWGQLTPPEQLVLADAQTSGGLLVATLQPAALLSRLRGSGVEVAEIGATVAGAPGGIEVVGRITE